MSSAAPPTRRSPQEVRRLLIAAAERVFARKAYSDVTAEEIAEAAAVSRSAMYRHFANKAELFDSAVVAPFTESLAQYDATWRDQQDEPWDEVRLMRAMVTIYYDAFVEHRNAVLALAASASDSDAAARIQPALDAVFTRMREIGTAEVRLRGWIDLDRLDLSIRIVLGSIAAAAVLDRLFLADGTASPSREQLIDHLTTQGLYGLRHRR